MRFLFVRSTSGVSGAEIYSIMLLNALRKRKISVELVTNHQPFLRRLKKEHISAFEITQPVKEAGTKRELAALILWAYPMVLLYLKKIKERERHGKFDAVILESMNEKLFLTPYLKLAGYRVVWIEHGPLFIANRSDLVKRLYVHKSKWPDAILAVSHDTAGDLLRGGVRKEKIRVVPIGVDRVKKGIDKEGMGKSWTIGYLGSVATEKGIEEYLAVANRMVKKYENVRFMVIGGGPKLEWAKSFVQSHQLETFVECTGNIDTADTLLSKTDILFFPTRHHEGLSLAVLGAMAGGVVVVARDIGGNRELVIDKKTGFLFTGAERNGERILERILSGKESLSAIRTNTVAHIRKHFSMQKQLPKFISLFHG